MSVPPSMPTPSDPPPHPPLSPRGGEDIGEGDLALCRSALWEALALGFRLPTEETAARLASPDGAGALADAAALLDVEQETDLTARVLGLARRDGLDDLENSFRRLFGHTARGTVPPYETEDGGDSLILPALERGDLA